MSNQNKSDKVDAATTLAFLKPLDDASYSAENAKLMVLSLLSNITIKQAEATLTEMVMIGVMDE